MRLDNLDAWTIPGLKKFKEGLTLHNPIKTLGKHMTWLPYDKTQSKHIDFFLKKTLVKMISFWSYKKKILG
jgi:hypothetical protein